MKASAKKTQERIDYKVEVTHAKEIKDGVVAFDMKVNGVTIYGMFYREYTTKEGKEGDMISFPSQKADNGNYYSHAWFPVSNDLKMDIVKQLAHMLESN